QASEERCDPDAREVSPAGLLSNSLPRRIRSGAPGVEHGDGWLCAAVTEGSTGTPIHDTQSDMLAYRMHAVIREATVMTKMAAFYNLLATSLFTGATFAAWVAIYPTTQALSASEYARVEQLLI